MDALQAEVQEMNSLLTNAEASQREAEMAHELELRRLQLELENKTRELNAAKEQMNDVSAEFQKYKVRPTPPIGCSKTFRADRTS